MNRVGPSDRQLSRVRWPLRNAVIGSDPGTWRAVGAGQGMELATVRDYVTGDDPRRINWTATARTGTLQVVVPVAERALTTLIAIDTSGSMATGIQRTKMSVAIEAAETLSRIATKYSDRLDLFAAGDDVLRAPTRQGKGALYNAQTMLSTLQASGVGQFAINLQESLRKRPGLVIAISDWRTAVDRNALLRCSERTETIAVCVVDSAERVLPEVGLITVEDPETGRQFVLDTSDAKFRSEFGRRAQALTEEFEMSAQGCVALLYVYTDGPHGGMQVIDQLQNRARRS